MLEMSLLLALFSSLEGSFNVSDMSKLPMDNDTGGCDSRRHVIEIPLTFHDPPFCFTGPITIGYEKFNVIFDSGSEAIWATSRKLNELILSNETIVDYMQQHDITIGRGYSNPTCSNQIEPYISAPLNRIGEAISCCCDGDDCKCDEDLCDCSCCLQAGYHDDFLCLLLTEEQHPWSGNDSGNYNYTSFHPHRECDTSIIQYTCGSVESVVLYDTIKFDNDSIMYGNYNYNLSADCMDSGKKRKKSIKYVFFCSVLYISL